MANNRHVATREDWTILLPLLGLMVVMAAVGVAIAAGVLVSDIFGGGLSPSEVARYHGISASIGAYEAPLALTGIATVFTGIVVALARIRVNIRGRRDALVRALPRVLQPTT